MIKSAFNITVGLSFSIFKILVLVYKILACIIVFSYICSYPSPHYLIHLSLPTLTYPLSPPSLLSASMTHNIKINSILHGRDNAPYFVFIPYALNPFCTTLSVCSVGLYSKFLYEN